MMRMTATVTEVNYRPAVEAGGRAITARLRHEEWVYDVDLDTLNMRSTYLCVLAQVFGGFWAGIETLGWHWSMYSLSDTSPEEHGFRIPLHLTAVTDPDHYVLLRDTWKQYILERRAALEKA